MSLLDDNYIDKADAIAEHEVFLQGRTEKAIEDMQFRWEQYKEDSRSGYHKKSGIKPYRKYTIVFKYTTKVWKGERAKTFNAEVSNNTNWDRLKYELNDFRKRLVEQGYYITNIYVS